MNSLFSGFTHDRDTMIIFLSWAEKHPYLFTLIEITSPTLYIILAVAGFNVINGMMRPKRR
jgi:ABC-type lipoprotein release transport system permease subunit